MFLCAFTISSDTRYLPILRQLARAACDASGSGRISPGADQACTLALIEAVDNAIFHVRPARRSARERRGRFGLPIRVSVAVDGRRMTIEVVDCGRGIGRRRKQKPDEMVEHGRGLFLIHSLASQVESRMKRGRHSLRMVFDL
ncbi:MAG TPA: ATP-binding protein [bacterium]|nr:ATP-binding protein [bacterium]